MRPASQQRAWLTDTCLSHEDAASSWAYKSRWQPKADAMSGCHNRAVALHLDGNSGNDRLCVDQRGVAKVVQAAAAQDLGTSLPPHGLAELRAAANSISGWIILIASAPERQALPHNTCADEDPGHIMPAGWKVRTHILTRCLQSPKFAHSAHAAQHVHQAGTGTRQSLRPVQHDCQAGTETGDSRRRRCTWRAARG